GRHHPRGHRRTGPCGGGRPRERTRLARHDSALARSAPRPALLRTKRSQRETDRRPGCPCRHGDSIVKNSIRVMLVLSGCWLGLAAVAARESLENPIVPAGARLELLHKRQVKL